jgi:SlyX protein
MPQENPIESRLVDLEVKASFTDDLLDQLNLVVYRQQQQIDRLLSQVNQLRRQMPEGDANRMDGTMDARSELPPHY